MYRYWDPPYSFPFYPRFTFTSDILFFIFILKDFMALPISLPDKHLTLPHSYPSIACALVHHNLQLRPFPDYDKLPDSHYLQCTTISNIYRIFSPELKWKKLPLKQIKFRKRRDNSWIFSELCCPANVCEGLCWSPCSNWNVWGKAKCWKWKAANAAAGTRCATTLNEKNWNFTTPSLSLMHLLCQPQTDRKSYSEIVTTVFSTTLS